MADRMQFRRDTAANWTAYNPILLEGELGFELDTDQYKLGDGIHNWNNLPYRGMPCVQQRGTSTTTPMSQKAVTDELEALDADIEELGVDVNNSLEKSINPIIQEIDGKFLNLGIDRNHEYIGADGTINLDVNYSLLIDVSSLRGLHLTRQNGYYYQYAFLKDYDRQNLKATFCDGTGRITDDLTNAEVPSDANYLYWYMGSNAQVTTNFYPVITIDEHSSVGIKSTVDSIDRALFLPVDEIKEFQWVNGSGLIKGGMVEPTTNKGSVLFDIYVFQVSAGKDYFVSVKNTDTEIYHYIINWFDSSRNFISHSSETIATFHNQKVTAPENAAYLYINVERVNASYCRVIDWEIFKTWMTDEIYDEKRIINANHYLPNPDYPYGIRSFNDALNIVPVAKRKGGATILVYRHASNSLNYAHIFSSDNLSDWTNVDNWIEIPIGTNNESVINYYISQTIKNYGGLVCNPLWETSSGDIRRHANSKSYCIGVKSGDEVTIVGRKSTTVYYDLISSIYKLISLNNGRVEVAANNTATFTVSDDCILWVSGILDSIDYTPQSIIVNGVDLLKPSVIDDMAAARKFLIMPYEIEAFTAIDGYNANNDYYTYNVIGGRYYTVGFSVESGSSVFVFRWYDENLVEVGRSGKYAGPTTRIVRTKAPDDAVYLKMIVLRKARDTFFVSEYLSDLQHDIDKVEETADMADISINGPRMNLSPDVSIVRNDYLNAAAYWTDGQSANLHSFILDVSKARGCRITKVSGNGGTQYAFLKGFNDTFAYFCDGCSRVDGVVNDTLIPNDAKYLYQFISKPDWTSESFTMPTYKITDNSVIERNLPNLMISKVADSIHLYRKLYKNVYLMVPINYGVAAYEVGAYPSDHDNWGVKRPVICSYDNDSHLMVDVETLFRNGEAELAIRLPRGDGQSGNIYVGGQTHGFDNIIVTDGNRHVTILVDNQAISENAVIPLKPITSFKMSQESNLSYAYSQSAPWAKALKTWAFDNNGLSITTKVDVLENIADIQNCMMGMFCVYRHANGNTSKPYLTNKAIKNNSPFTIFDLSDGWESNSETAPLRSPDKECTSIIEYGEKGIGFRMTIKDANTLGSGGMDVSTNSSSYNKIYYGHGNNFSAAIGDVFKATQIWEFETKEFV